MNNSDSSMDLADDLFVAVARVLDDDEPPALVDNSTLTKVGETPTSTQREAELAAAVDRGKRVLCTDCKPGQGLRVISPNAADFLLQHTGTLEALQSAASILGHLYYLIWSQPRIFHLVTFFSPFG